jgi:hypothetical protein
VSAAERNPSAGYLRDANYYRLYYQLVAQEAHLASSDGGDSVERSGRAWHLAEEVARTLDIFYRRQHRALFMPTQGLNGAELRLQRFLAGTVEPCTWLIIAVGNADDGQDPGDYVLRSVRTPRKRLVYKRFSRRPEVSVIEWSYRAYYNLACSRAECARRAADSRELEEAALSALDEAFRRVYGPSRADLLRWAEKDPSLRDVSRSSAFEQLLREYALQPSPQPPSKRQREDASPS